jgi:hypothetical protein
VDSRENVTAGGVVHFVNGYVEKGESFKDYDLPLIIVPILELDFPVCKTAL